jgi:tRNA-dihydrouridine synthase 2
MQNVRFIVRVMCFPIFYRLTEFFSIYVAVTGVVSYNGKSRAMFTTHPIEKPYLIYQIGSADPELAVQAAKTVMQDVSGVDLNCGCPKPFSTHSGMGAALLSNPDLLCGILEALRRELPREISVSAKIRLLPTQDETKKLVERIARTGVNAITIHCRTRNMRPRERALVERLREIVEFVHELGLDVAIVENGDCTGREDARRVRELTGVFNHRSSVTHLFTYQLFRRRLSHDCNRGRVESIMFLVDTSPRC